MHPVPPTVPTELEPLRLAAVLAHVLPATDIVVATTRGPLRIGPLARGGQLPVALLREAVAGALAADDVAPVVELLGGPVAALRTQLVLGHASTGARAIGGGIYEVRWAGRTTCLFATVLAEEPARQAVRRASTYPKELDGVPVRALGIDPCPHRIAVVADTTTATTVFGLDRATGADAEVVGVVRAAMTAAAAACLVAELRSDRQPHQLPPDR